MPQRRPGLRGCRKETTLPSLTGELTVAGFNRGAIEKCDGVFARNHHQGARFLAKHRPSFSQTRASAFSLKKIDVAHDGSQSQQGLDWKNHK
jgi:hypothetical protein